MSAAARFTLLGSDGAAIADSAATAVAALDNTTGLVWTIDEMKPMSWKKARAAVKKLTVAGFTDWRLPTVAELVGLVDYSRHMPAIDTTTFSRCESNWYWTGTPAAFSPGGYAWFVYFVSGSAFWSDQGSVYFVRAVRASQSLGIGTATAQQKVMP